MADIYNFCAGPAMLPAPVMRKAQQELLDWQGLGTSVMEVSHRGKHFIEMADKSERDLRTLLNIPSNYKVLFMHGGGRGQFAAVPLNMTKPGDQAAFVDTGVWSKKAVEEASRFIQTDVVASSYQDEQGLWHVPQQSVVEVADQAKYLHFCPNETIEGLEFNHCPQASNGAPVIADMSSTILSRPINVSDYGIIYAGAQKNIGPSGLAVAIVRDDLVGYARKETPAILNYQLTDEFDSMYNTPPTYSWYLAALVFEWLLEQGGVAAMAQRNEAKANILYDYIDQSDFYRSQVAKDSRSWMNVPFQLASDALNADFLVQSEAAGLRALKGHRIVGGMRASIYNAMPEQGVIALVDFMKEFERTHG
ncbi:3-phosphoserine/phosphohydroxythreonine transaminase [Neiella marina]|uniref:Phosphoserine aminotransferase n=1 Tax=Neiella holothuriorum TaxID=2870530 RepID=A0ABS7EJ64_9GAMM|nr:3-phosphoserine/phosphohydroxythreonine transaminase [Neiella holothuriorum]MBW8192376.1 3-phosphoserine/phosphohydroxythreonine transaminase [Neiella holothuriorum]